MCDPITLGVAMAGSSVMQGMGAASAAEDMNDIKDGIAAQNERNAITAHARNAQAQYLRNRQNQYTDSQQARNVRIKAAIQRGTFKAGAASGSVEGTTIGDLQTDFEMQEAIAMSAINTNSEMNKQQMSNQMEQLTAQTQNRINAGAPQYTPVPSMMGTLLNAFGAGLSGYSMGMNITSGGATSGITGSGNSTAPTGP